MVNYLSPFPAGSQQNIGRGDCIVTLKNLSIESREKIQEWNIDRFTGKSQLLVSFWNCFLQCWPSLPVECSKHYYLWGAVSYTFILQGEYNVAICYYYFKIYNITGRSKLLFISTLWTREQWYKEDRELEYGQQRHWWWWYSSFYKRDFKDINQWLPHNKYFTTDLYTAYLSLSSNLVRGYGNWQRITESSVTKYSLTFAARPFQICVSLVDTCVHYLESVKNVNRLRHTCKRKNIAT